MIRKVVASR